MNASIPIILSLLASTSPATLAALPALGPVYLICLIVGGGLLLISTLFGGNHDSDVALDGADLDGVDLDGFDLDGAADIDLHTDVDFDGAADIDMGADAHVDLDGGIDHAHGGDLATEHVDGPLALSTWLSVRFFVYFAAVFGLIGTTLTRMTDVSPGWILGLALGGGVAFGQFVQQTLRALQRSGGNSQMRIKDFVGQIGRVTVAVRPPDRGEVGVQVGNKEIFLPAAAQREDDSFNPGERVAIVAYAGGTVEIVSREEHEFLSKN